MKYALTFVMAAMFTVASSVQAQEAAPTPTPLPAPAAEAAPAAVYQAAPVRVTRRVRRNSQTFLGRVIELERRKNAWLRRTFLGR